LIESGAIKAPLTATGVFKGITVKATIQHDGSFSVNGRLLSSPSVAAGVAITEATGWRSPGRQYASVNGWHFWTVEAGGGEQRSLSDIRLSA
jgi:hypothetical protein